MPRPPRRTKPPHVAIEHGEPALLPMPHELDIQCRAERAILPQPNNPVPGMHAVPYQHSRLELRSVLLQVGADHDTQCENQTVHPRVVENEMVADIRSSGRACDRTRLRRSES